MRSIACFVSFFILLNPAIATDLLTMRLDSRSVGMGGAEVTLPISLKKRIAISLNHAVRRSELGSFNFAETTYRFSDQLAFSISWRNFALDDIPIYPTFDPNINYAERRSIEKFRPTFEPIGFFGDRENAYQFGLLTKFRVSQNFWDKFGRNSRPPEISIRPSLIYVSQKIGQFSASDLAETIAILLNFPDLNAIIGADGFGSIAIGVEWRSEIDLKWNTPTERTEKDLSQIRFGASYRNRFFDRDFLIAWERVLVSFSTHFGCEIWLTKSIAIRSGVIAKKLAIGFGLKTKIFRIDYAFTNNELRPIHFFGMTTNF